MIEKTSENSTIFTFAKFHEFVKFQLSQAYTVHVLLIKSIIPDLAHINIYQWVFLFLFTAASVIFNVLDFNVLVNNDGKIPEGMSLIKYENDKTYGIAYWKRVIFCLSSAAAVAGVVCVFLTSLGRISCYSWGIVNCILYGVYCFAYGYSGSAQLNIIFFLPMQYVGVAQWMDEMKQTQEPASSTAKNSNVSTTTTATTAYDVTTTGTAASTTNTPDEDAATDAVNAVRTRSMSPLQWVLCLAVTGAISVAFYYEIPEFSRAVTGYYEFELKPVPWRLDAVNNGLSIVAQILMLLRYWESWIFWHAVNIVQIAMFTGVAGYGVDFNIIFMLCLFEVNACYGMYLWYVGIPSADSAVTSSSGESSSGKSNYENVTTNDTAEECTTENNDIESNTHTNTNTANDVEHIIVSVDHSEVV